MPRDLAIGLIATMLEERTGQQLNPDRYWRVESVLASLLRERGMSSSDDLTVLLTQPEGSDLADDLVDGLLNNETYFFRDRNLFEKIAETILPNLAQNRQDRRKLTIWSAGCASGQEALSLALIFDEQRERWADWRIDITATDISPTMIAQARRGFYTQFEIQRGLGVSQMMKHFKPVDGGWQASDALLAQVRYQVRSVHETPPFPGVFDLILCRNMLLYFSDEIRSRTLNLLSGALADDGLLMLGGGETIQDFNQGLRPAPEGAGFYRKSPTRDGGHTKVLKRKDRNPVVG